jgi:hypothetical protein
MLHPEQFEVNEAWIAFRLNRAPIRTEHDGEFDCIALMDAASCFILSTELFPVDDAEPGQAQARRLLEAGQSHKQQWPGTLFVAKEELFDLLVQEATRQAINVVRISERDLLIFTREARDAFAERFEQGAP